MKRLTLTASLLALAGVLSFAPLFADDPAETKSRKSDKSQKAGQNDDQGDKNDNQGEKRDSTSAHGKGRHEHSLPGCGCLEKLSLNEEQQSKIRDIANRYDSEIEDVWHRFKSAYRDTIRTEVLLITAIEDNLTEDQQRQVRNARRMRAHQAKTAGKSRGKMRSVSDTSTARTEARIKKETGVAAEGEKREGQRGGNDQRGSNDPAGAITDTALNDIALTPEQEDTAQELHDKYFSRLRSLSRQIDALHSQLIALEADELAEIETVLTKDQLEQFRDARGEGPTGSTVADRNAETKSSRETRE